MILKAFKWVFLKKSFTIKAISTMRRLFILLFIWIPLISYSQFKFPNDMDFKSSNLKELKDFRINPIMEDTQNFELRLWVETAFVDSTYLLRLTHDEKDTWKAEKYLINNHKATKTEIQLPTNWDCVWDTLVVHNILTLPDRPSFLHKPTVNDDNKYPIVEIAITDGTTYTVELLSKENKRKYSIDNPIGYFRHYTHSKPLKDFNRILGMLSGVFNSQFR